MREFMCTISKVLIISLLLYGCSRGGGSSDNNQVSGLTARPSNTTCSAVDKSQSTDVELTRVFANVNFARPILMLQIPGNASRWYIVEQAGQIYWIDATDPDTDVRNTVLDLPAQGISIRSFANDSRCNECGLLGMAFDPDFASNGFVYLSFTAPENNPATTETLQSFVSRFTSSDGGLTLDASSRVDILNVLQPFNNHNGGHIVFGPDGFLYVGLGDGGSGNDPPNNGQNINTLLGSMLRLNTDGSPAAGNIVASQGGLPEIYAYGLRNPWRWSFDRQTNDLWLGDVGQNQFEEVDIIVNGGNYGWRCREGLQTTSNNCTSTGPFIDPVAQYGRSEGVSITGGYVYRGNAIPALNGVYLFADFGFGTIWGLFPTGSAQYDRRVLINSGLNVASFAEDQAGELYISTFTEGLYRIDQAPSATGNSGPANDLIDTGCVNPNDASQPAAGLIPYGVNEPFWSDGAVKQRFIALPDNTTISVDSDGDFEFPVGTVLVKMFRLNGRLIETRLFMRETTGRWNGYSYQWNNAQTAATLLSTASDVVIDGQLWHYPSGAECLQCHTSAANFSLGLEARQLNRDFTYPSTGITANQLTTLQRIGVLSGTIPNIENNPLANSANGSNVIEQRARSYLHSNCSNCHRPGGVTQSTMDLRVSTALTNTDTCNIAPQRGDLGVSNAMLIAPGEPNRSILLERMNRLDGNRMPPTSSHVIDTVGVELIRDWIMQITNC